MGPKVASGGGNGGGSLLRVQRPALYVRGLTLYVQRVGSARPGDLLHVHELLSVRAGSLLYVKGGSKRPGLQTGPSLGEPQDSSELVPTFGGPEGGAKGAFFTSGDRQPLICLNPFVLSRP